MRGHVLVAWAFASAPSPESRAVVYRARRGGVALITPGEVVKFFGWLAVMYTPVRRFAEVNVVYQTSLAAIERVFEVFDITPKIVEAEQPVANSPERGVVRFENVTFDYLDDSDESRVSLEEPHAERREPTQAQELRELERQRLRDAGKPPEHRRRPVLDGMSFEVAAGERVALGTGLGTSLNFIE